MKVIKNKFGFFAYEKITWKKIKRLRSWYYVAIQQAANWNRWHAKKPENRTVQIKEQIGDKTVVKLVVPKSEPFLVPVFTQKQVVISYFDRDGKYVPGGFNDEKVSVCDMGILALYDTVKKPKKYLKNVPEITHTDEEITAMLKKINAVKGKWH